MHKGTIVQDIRRASRQIREAGIDLGYFIMFAYPGENRDDIRKTEQLIFEINPESLGLSIAYPVPGTPFYERVKDHLVHRQEEKTDVQMGSGRKLVFQAMYPGVYYRRLIQYIERRRSLNQPNQSSVAWFFRAIRICPDLMILRGIEWFWSTFFDKDAVKANVIS
jgi:radical SAM superfamily enzyme YgiQ (UPF0313 family)